MSILPHLIACTRRLSSVLYTLHSARRWHRLVVMLRWVAHRREARVRCLPISSVALLLRQMRSVLSVDMRHAGIQSAKALVHDTDLRPQLIILLLILSCVLCLGADLAQPISHVVLLRLYGADMLNSCKNRLVIPVRTTTTMLRAYPCSGFPTCWLLHLHLREHTC